MADRNLSLALRLYADSANFVRGLANGQQGVKRFTAVAKQEFDALRNAMRSVQGQIATIGGGVTAVGLAVQSAKMDKSLGQIGLTADLSAGQVGGQSGHAGVLEEGRGRQARQSPAALEESDHLEGQQRVDPQFLERAVAFDRRVAAQHLGQRLGQPLFQRPAAGGPTYGGLAYGVLRRSLRLRAA